MQTVERDEQDNSLPPPGSRSGAGAQSVLPYLTKTLQAKPAALPEREGRPAGGDPVLASAPPKAH
jgi:hypothetical protein